MGGKDGRTSRSLKANRSKYPLLNQRTPETVLWPPHGTYTLTLIHANACIGTHSYKDYKMATSVLNSLKTWLSNWNFHHCGELERCRLRAKLSWAVAGPLDHFSSLASVWLLCKFPLRWYEPYSPQTGQQQQTKEWFYPSPSWQTMSLLRLLAENR